MTKDFDLEFNEDHLRISPGLNYKRDFRNGQLWMILAEACHTHNCRQVLNEVQIFSNGMALSDVYFTVRLIAEMIPGIKMALTVDNHITSDLLEFVELTASNRSIAISFFSDRKQAIDWLTSSNRKLDP